MAIDNTGWQSWEQVKTPDGAVLYKVPNSDLVYDPVLSQSRGQNVYRKNPQSAIDEQNRVRKLQEQQANPVTQLIPVAGSVAGTVGAGWLLNGAKTPSWLSGAPAATEAATAAAPAATTAANAFSAGVAAPAASVSGLGPVASGGEYAANIGQPGLVQSGLQSVGVGADTANMIGNQVLPGIGAALSAYQLGTGLMDGKKDILGGALSGAGLGASAALLGAGPVGWLALGGAALGGLGEGLFTHKSTKQYQAERWGNLAKQGIAGAAEQKQALDSLGDMAGKDPITGEKWNFETALNRVKSGQTAEFNGVYGNFKTFGNDWANYSNEQKSQISKAIADAGLYESKKGDVLIKDAEAARKIKDQILGQQLAGKINART